MKRIVILGAGESGTGAALLANAKGYDVFVSDMAAIADKYKTIWSTITLHLKKGNTQKHLFSMQMKW